MISDNRSSLFKKICMAALAAYPILCYYRIGTYFNYASLISIVLFFIGLVKGLFSNFRFPKWYLVFWVYQWIVIALISGYSGLNSIIPGGMGFFCASLAVAVYASFFDIELFRKYSNTIFVLAACLFFVQFSSVLLTGKNIPFFLHLGDELAYVDMSYSQLVNLQSFSDRPCSIFPEPAYFAAFCCFTLTIELFCENNIHKLFTPLSLVIALVIILGRSGLGLLTLAAIAIIKIIQFAITERNRRSIYLLLLALPLMYFGVRYYIGTEIGIGMLERQDSITDVQEMGSGYVRVLGGYNIFGRLNAYEKILGGSTDFMSSLHEDDTFINGVCSTLISFGALGLLLQLLMFINGCNRKQFVVIAIVIVFYFVSLIESQTLYGRGYMIALVITSTLALKKGKA